MKSVNLDKEYYHKQGEMIKWCLENVGEGGWLHRDDPAEDSPFKWELYSMFGNLQFTFYDDKDATLFSLKWL